MGSIFLTPHLHTIQFVADNVDHNLDTLDGRSTFHGMGIIATVTPAVSKSRVIPRTNASLKDVQAIGKIAVYFRRSDWKGLSNIAFLPLPDTVAEDRTAQVDLLWKISWPLKTPRPAWNGMMQDIYKNPEHPGRSAIFFLPMIDMSASDMSSIYSTLKFICSQAQKQNVTPVVTFDQPLYLKALAITTSESSDVQDAVLRFGAFHLLMSFLGAVDHLMAGSGLQDILEHVYAPNTVPHIMSGKAYARALRAYFLVDASLNAIFVADAFQVPQILFYSQQENDTDDRDDQAPTGTCSLAEIADCGPEAELSELLEENFGSDSLNAAKELLEGVLCGKISVEDISKSEILSKIGNQLQCHRQTLSKCHTAKLWMQFMDMMDIVRKAIKAERLGNMALHLQSVKDMLPYLSAAGHNNYTKCARLYLQQMMALKDTHPDVFDSFSKGHHSVRRSDRVWAGLPTDLVIEQELMRGLKSAGGLTRGSGMGEEERLVWCLGMPACAEVSSVLQSLTGVHFSTGSDQHKRHKEMSKTRQNRDHKDTATVLRYLLDINPFSGRGVLQCIATGRIADQSVSVHEAKQVGEKILNSMTDKTVLEVKLKKKDQAVAMHVKQSTHVADITIVDSALLFQRLVKVAEQTPEALEGVFSYELSNIPTALFDSSGLPRQANKAVLAQYLWTSSGQTNAEIPENADIVIDGGSLLHRLPWPRGSTYAQLVEMYVDFIIRTFNRGTIVFDGYNQGPSTKDVAHMRRSHGGNVGATTTFDGDMLLCDSKERFLRNSVNKQSFILMLDSAVQAHGFSTRHACADADRMIVETTLEKAQDSDVVLIGEDTDLLVLLLANVQPDHKKVYFKSSSSKSKTEARIWDIKVIQACLGTDVCDNILFAHAFAVCDTVSSPFGLGKSLPLKKLRESSTFRKQAQIFNSSSDLDEIVSAGEKALALMYGGKEGDGLNKLRYIKYVQKLSSSSSSMQPNKLPPTSSAAKFHSMRTYFQVQEWRHLRDDNFVLNPIHWGWETKEGMMFPLYTDVDVAPEDLIHIVKCNCKTDCQSSRCSCRRHGLVCSVGCTQCRGESCLNSSRKTDCPEFEVFLSSARPGVFSWMYTVQGRELLELFQEDGLSGVRGVPVVGTAWCVQLDVHSAGERVA